MPSTMWRRLRKEAEGARNDLKRRDREDDNDSENAPAKRIDIKYDEVDLLTLKSTFRAWTDWKADLERVWAGAPWKYERDTLKIIKAVSKMDKACELAGMPMFGSTQQRTTTTATSLAGPVHSYVTTLALKPPFTKSTRGQANATTRALWTLMPT